MSRLELTGVVKAFEAGEGPVVAARDFHLAVDDGAIYALLGPSGCGKSTVLRCVAGLEQPDRGRISLGGRILFDAARGTVVPAHERRIGMVFQSYAIWPHMDVFDNVAYPLQALRPRWSRSAIADAVVPVLRMVGLDAHAHRAATRLSGGQQQRVALARALVREPDLLLLDEPLSNLDAKLRQEMRQELRELVKRAGITALYVTHDQTEAFGIADRIGVMVDGRIIQEGAPRAVYARPASAFTASFLGNANLLAGVVDDVPSPGCVRVRIGTCTQAVEVVAAGAWAAGDRVILMVRPEDVVVSTESGSPATIPASVEHVVFEGARSACTVRIGGEVLRIRVDREFDPPPGSRLGVCIDAGRSVLYAPEPLERASGGLSG